MAAKLSQVAQKVIHVLEGRAVNEVTSIALLTDQIGVHQLFQVEGQCGGGHLQLRRQIPWRESLRASDNQGTKDTQTHGLGQCGEGFNDVFLFHTPMVIE
ncbi:MAG: hypothetical protein A2711_14050 [Burkholderiales bacterium RIFCSPHIGHO2_01_FULL_63_240]|nr:MAG: hypothetical protein A2711_14050 [Burkholderiales bacterium RIFCSPHIGHO2_01_FULL_63_240]